MNRPYRQSKQQKSNWKNNSLYLLRMKYNCRRSSRSFWARLQTSRRRLQRRKTVCSRQRMRRHNYLRRLRRWRNMRENWRSRGLPRKLPDRRQRRMQPPAILHREARTPMRVWIFRLKWARKNCLRRLYTVNPVANPMNRSLRLEVLC